MTALPHKISVTVVTAGHEMPLAGPGVAVIRLDPPLHDHGAGDLCVACAARTDVRTLLFELIEAARQGLRDEPRAVLVDARAVDPDPVIAAIEGRAPAKALRDHTVARRFRPAS
ncbi:hypothetical protein [Devosia pacifica]|uniref:hypothetical protein n=1 Tax=Devosia pacifica TaxID=1335967 RepID=UPI0016769C85|nr:hypothetical protein [Devosia pacifica]